MTASQQHTWSTARGLNPAEPGDLIKVITPLTAPTEASAP